MKKTKTIGKLKIVYQGSKREKTGIRLALAVGFFFLGGLFLSKEFRVIRAEYMTAESAAIHTRVNDLHKWESWFPWEKLGNPLNFTFGDITSGAGAQLNWNGDDGKGFLTLIKSSPEKGIDYKLSLNDGLYECNVSLHYTEVKKGEIYVRWTVNGNIPRPVIGGYIALTMEPFAGAILDQGLENLRNSLKQDIKKQK